MNKLLKILIPIISIVFSGMIFAAPALADQEDYTFAVYFSGIGCHHCEISAPMVLEQLPDDYPQLIIVEYEIYGEEENTLLFDQYLSTYAMEYEIPAIVFGAEQILSGYLPIYSEMRDLIEGVETNPCPMMDGSTQDFASMDLTALPGYPAIWHQEKVLIKEGPEGDNELLKSLLTSASPADILKDTGFEIVEVPEIPVPGKEIQFEHGVRIGDWVLLWNGEGVEAPPITPDEPEPSTPVTPDEPEPSTPVTPDDPEPSTPSITLPKIVSLAIADAINPCAFAVLLLMLVSIMAYNPGNRKSILLAGAAFIGSIFVMYFLYGLLFIKLFQTLHALTAVRFWLFRVLSVAAIVFGALNIRDFIRYKPGGIGTEMPLFMRPRVKKIMSGITSPKGALLTGVIVTVFLLPCTIGPYIIAAGILSVYGIAETMPTLLLYNLIFVVPLIVIVISVYFGTSKVHDFYKWKEKNINKMHLVAGITILGIGIYMLLESLGIAAFWGLT